MQNSPRHDNWQNTAATIVCDTARSDARYKAMREEITRRIVVRCLAIGTVEQFRAAGGRSTIAQGELAEVLSERAADASAVVGSKMYPLTIGACVRMDFADIRAEAYRREFNAR